LAALKLELEEAVRDERGEVDKQGRVLKSDDVELSELAVLPNAEVVGRSATDIQLRTRYGVNLLAVSRQGRSPIGRLRNMRLKTGDVLLMQGSSAALAEFSARYGCVPLTERHLKLDQPERALTAAVVLLGAIALTVSGLAAPAIAFAAGVLLYLLIGIVSPREVYHSVDWPVIVLLGALIPVAGAMATTGAADLIASVLLDGVAQGRPILALVVVLILSMTLSDFMNNAATAAVMCPIAIGTAERLSASADPFLMAVAIGASCAFLTPIGHQNNTLILGPGGFRFGDYWRLGLPLELIVIAVGIPMIIWIWPLGG
jgi:di/tricarboxylate transporter